MQEVFGVIWIDSAFGPLTLTKATADAAIQAAAAMRRKGADKIHDCRAVHVKAGETKLTYLDWE